MDYQLLDDYDEIGLQHFDEQVEIEMHDDHVQQRNQVNDEVDEMVEFDEMVQVVHDEHDEHEQVVVYHDRQ